MTVTTQCADNAHVRSGSSLSVRCTSSGSWSGTPVCECDAGYQAATVSGRQICRSKPCFIIFGKSRNNFPIFAGVPPTTCSERSVGLVRYPTTLAPASGSVTVTTQCADNAHVRSGSSLSVRCNSSGSWSGTTPICECDAGYRAVSVSGRQICQSKPCSIIFGKSRNNFPIFAGVPPTTCSERSVGLAHYPITLAPASRSVTVTTQCADNAHVRSGSSLSVRCTSSGSWSGTTPICECDAGYLPVTVSTGRQVCQSERKHKNSVMQTNIKILFFSSQQLLVRQQQVR